MPLHTEKQRRAYLFTMETFQRAFWDIVKATAQWRNSNMRERSSRHGIEPVPTPTRGHMLYKVVWEIDLHAETPREAAEIALRMQRDRDSIATVFEVTEPSGNKLVFDLK